MLGLGVGYGDLVGGLFLDVSDYSSVLALCFLINKVGIIFIERVSNFCVGNFDFIVKGDGSIFVGLGGRFIVK